MCYKLLRKKVGWDSNNEINVSATLTCVVEQSDHEHSENKTYLIDGTAEPHFQKWQNMILESAQNQHACSRPKTVLSQVVNSCNLQTLFPVQ